MSKKNNTIFLLEKVYNVQGLVFALNSTLWNMENTHSQDKEFKSLFALGESIEKGVNAIKRIIEKAVNIE